MDSILIRAAGPLSGTIPISGAKNAALPLMIASMLTDEPVLLENMPRLADVEALTAILSNHGVDVQVRGKREGDSTTTGRRLEFRAKTIVDTTAPYELVRKMRASFWVIGPLLARCGVAKVSLPGGCAIGTRPIDLFIDGLEALGVEIDIDAGYVNAKAPAGGLKGGHFTFPKVSVGATHVMLMAASLANGQTVIENAAREPEVTDVAECLVSMGAKISGIGTSTLTIDGVSSLHGTTHSVLPDRIETGTFAACVAMTGGDVLLAGARPELLRNALDVLEATGTQVGYESDGLRISRSGDRIAPIDFTTEPFPGFPTDLQAQFMALATRADGVSTVKETIFENRFMHVQELARLGADISIDGQTATVTGVKRMSGAQVMATDLRASMSLVIAGLVADGETQVNRVYHLDRGFELLEEKLSGVGADIERVSGD
ncbi:UDP-N-acetylglucosamine 1-carboxyvinyltransferase [Ahrensia sp. R2A130]|uniref:UDP-N-acetylglucosamine 1-carboxyvinyltransferase n=1 Tax=Ahrensia sp. R2A130 TaxID=744979 RepID=UPI0001E0E89A|nr:UDP-N-acetylglucosamine 1-carboxyvinyltransferase [Ahrensia sp. R2A130]EFL89352.1 UDP-N-acetylglucosamine 1-carboxyvinyltransferase [Ahrensia sp. R2A130]